MRMRRTLAYLVFASCVLLVAVKNRAADARSGDWTISKSHDADKVEFSLIEHHQGGTSSHESDWPASSFQGVDFAKAGRQDVHFTIARDAGKIECEGFLTNGEGAGIFHFQPDANYPREMQALGFSLGVDLGARNIECEGFLNNGEGAGIFHFQPDANYPREMQALGFSVDDERQFRMEVLELIQ